MIFINLQARSSGTMTNGTEDLRGTLRMKDKCHLDKEDYFGSWWLKNDMGQNCFQQCSLSKSCPNSMFADCANMLRHPITG